MSLFLAEAELKHTSRGDVEAVLDRLAAHALAVQAELIEAQISEDLSRLFLIVEGGTADTVHQLLEKAGVKAAGVKQVRLLGQDLPTIKARKGSANYLVEWNFPAGLTMEAYLKRKAEKAPLYAQVPEIHFERTYVCEDMTKCLCFYDSPDESTVKRARDVVGAPVDALTPIQKIR